LLYWYKSTDTDALKAAAEHSETYRELGTQFTCSTGTKVQILTLSRRRLSIAKHTESSKK
jgi:hypothetical protein